MYPGPRFDIKMTSYQYRKSHCGDKTILRPSYLHNGISYTGKTTSLYWIRALVCCDLFQYGWIKTSQRIPVICLPIYLRHYCDVIMGTMVSQITSLTTVYSRIHSGTDHRKHQSSASLAFVRGIHRWPLNSTHKWPVTRKIAPFWWCHHRLLHCGSNRTIAAGL